jgi:hypothetical protein
MTMTLEWQRKHHPDGSATFTAGAYRIERVGQQCKIFVHDKLEDTLMSFEGARRWCLTHAASR